MHRVLLWIVVLLCLGFPILAFVGVGSMALMPGCTGGSSGPASGCYLFGIINLNWLVQLGTVAFVGSFLTVPAGFLVLIVSSVVSAFTRRATERHTERGGEG
jgi:hypothetical protein